MAALPPSVACIVVEVQTHFMRDHVTVAMQIR